LQIASKSITICNTGGAKMLTLRLNSELEKKLNNIAEMLGIPKSEIVRKSLKAYLKQLEKNNAWATGKSLFGKYSSGKSNLSENRKAILKQKLQDKRNAKSTN
jgi:metal-responsive CopG/Arc/MetJ family transcriptional regulator